MLYIFPFFNCSLLCPAYLIKDWLLIRLQKNPFWLPSILQSLKREVSHLDCADTSDFAHPYSWIPLVVFSLCELLLTEHSPSNALHSHKDVSITHRDIHSRWNLHYWWVDRNVNWFQILTLFPLNFSSKYFAYSYLNFGLSKGKNASIWIEAL